MRKRDYSEREKEHGIASFQRGVLGASLVVIGVDVIFDVPLYRNWLTWVFLALSLCSRPAVKFIEQLDERAKQRRSDKLRGRFRFEIR